MFVHETAHGVWSVTRWPGDAIADGVAVYLYGDEGSTMFICERHGSDICDHMRAVRNANKHHWWERNRGE